MIIKNEDYTARSLNIFAKMKVLATIIFLAKFTFYSNLKKKINYEY